MADTPSDPRVFTAELRRCRFRRNIDDGKPSNVQPSPVPIAAKTSPAPAIGVPGKPPGSDNITTLASLINYTPTIDNCDFLALQEEVSSLKEAIEHMKREIATLRMDKSPAPSLQKATCELDAVVQATEDATHNILEAAEQIDTILMDIRAKASVAVETATLERLGDHIVRIFESCNFQDITGQRINKVVNAMKFIEVKIDNMIEILGGKEALQQVEVVLDEEMDEDAKLLEGPQLEGESKISQNDIDRFFD